MSHPLRGHPAPTPPMEPVIRRTNHVLHLLLTLITFGMWIFVWPCVAVWNNHCNDRDRREYQVNLAHYHQIRHDWEQAQKG